MIIKQPKYSVCISNYNMDSTLDLSLKSIINQLNDDYEVLVIDDGSDDNSLNILSNIKNNFSNFLKKTTKQIKGRVFEVPGCRGFLLTENSPYLDKYFEIDKELITFNSLDEAKDKINFYLKNYNLTKKISELGYLKVINEHTYEKRFLEIYKKINN